MATTPHITTVLAAAALAVAAASSIDRPELLEGKQPRLQPTNRPTVHASFARESYRAGDQARLIVRAIATNVRVQITVTDTLRQVSKQYTNPQGTAFKPIQDTGAFATCP